MSNKQTHLIVTPDDSPIPGSVPFKLYFAGWLLANEYEISGPDRDRRAKDIKRLSEYLGVTREMIYMLLRGKTPPTKLIREKLGLETVWLAQALHAKPAKKAKAKK